MRSNTAHPNHAQVAVECVCLGLRRAARSVSRRYDEALRPLDLNNGQFSMLNVVAGLQPASVQAVADHLAMDRTTVTAALKPLQRRGLVDVTVAASDLRGRELALTRQGQALLGKALPLWQRAQAQLASDLGDADLVALRKQLSALR
jgi:DNA-binding MarR family transcriptional regulator